MIIFLLGCFHILLFTNEKLPCTGIRNINMHFHKYRNICSFKSTQQQHNVFINTNCIREFLTILDLSNIHIKMNFIMQEEYYGCYGWINGYYGIYMDLK